MPLSARNRLNSGKSREKDRVLITYDLFIDGAMRTVDLPFVTGVMADLSGKSKQPRPPVSKRRFVSFNVENFDNNMAEIAPRLELELDPSGNEDPVVIEFKEMSDFLPERVAENVPRIKALLEQRKRLHRLLNLADGDESGEALLLDLLKDKKLREAAAHSLVAKEGEPTAKTKETPAEE